jgi:transposase
MLLREDFLDFDGARTMRVSRRERRARVLADDDGSSGGTYAVSGEAVHRSPSPSGARFSPGPVPATLRLVVTASRRAELGDVRTLAVERVAAGEDVRTVAATLGVTPRTLQRWIVLSRSGVRAALEAKVATGRPRRLTAKSLRTLLVNKTPASCGVAGALWTIERLREVLAAKWSWPAHATTIARALDRVGLVPLRAPRAAASRAEDPQFRLWVRTRFARLVAEANRQSRTFIVLDAISAVQIDRPDRSMRGGSSVVSAFTLDGRWWFRVFDTPSSTYKVSRFLVDLAQEVGDVEAIASAAAMRSTTLFLWTVVNGWKPKPWVRSALHVATRQADEAAPLHLFWRVRALLGERMNTASGASE